MAKKKKEKRKMNKDQLVDHIEALKKELFNLKIEIMSGQNNNTSNMSVGEAFKILNLDHKKKITKEEINKAYTKIQKKIHPDISPETARLSSLVNEARDVLMKEII